MTARFLALYETPTDPEAFDRHYRQIHIPLLRQLPELRQYTVSRDVAALHGAPAVEGFPIAEGHTKPADDFFGKERRFAECGFTRVAAPSPRRVIMRRELG